MKLGLRLGNQVAAACLALAAAGCTLQAEKSTTGETQAGEPAAAYDAGAWTYWGGDAGQTRYAPLDQINLKTVDRLKIAWRWSADTSGDPSSGNYKSSPLLADGVLYIPWVNHGMAAIDAGTGKTIWTFEPQPVDIGGRGASLAPRSLAYWSDGREARLFHNSQDGRLIAVDARTGKPAPGFGKNGWINLREGLIEGTPAKDVGSVSPALVVGDIVVTQVIVSGGRNKESAPGLIRGYDVRTGKLAWTFNPIPHDGETGAETWENGSNRYSGAAGAGTMMSADPKLGYVYLPLETPTNEFYGGDRLGDGLFGESLVCLDARTGKRVWHYQIVHHGLWDYDLPSAPILHEITRGGKRIEVVTQLTKQGLTFVFDRRTGEPIWPIEERPVPASGVPGERASPTQPFPVLPEPFLRLGYSQDDLIDFTPELREQGLEIANQFTKGVLYTTPTEITATNRGTWLYPGTGGGPNWNGASFDPDTHILYTPMRLKPQFAGLRKGDPKTTNMDYYGGGGGAPITGPQGLPIMKPPYSIVVATDMDTGKHLWRIPIGDADDFVKQHPALQGLGLDFSRMGKFDVRPAPLLTRELLFLGESGNIGGGSGGPMFRAYDKRDGRVVWETEMPTLVTGAPITYETNGRQYVVVTVSKRGEPAELVALTLDGASDAGAAPAGGVPLAKAPASSKAEAMAVSASPEELALGEAKFAQTCALCHGQQGAGISGGNAPPLTGRSDYGNIKQVIRGGQGEMPSMAAGLSEAEIDAVAKYVVKTLAPQDRPKR
ncbi:MAG: PQQ-binding-like beta-propeller repeat protein [Hyphomonadaceae bacterium]